MLQVGKVAYRLYLPAHRHVPTTHQKDICLRGLKPLASQTEAPKNAKTELLPGRNPFHIRSSPDYWTGRFFSPTTLECAVEK
jgi:hypothetical protein